MRRKKKQVTRAAAVIRVALSDENRQDHRQLKAKLARHGISARQFVLGVRLIRDCYGDHSLITAHEGRRVVYVIDGSVAEGRSYVNEQSRRALAEMEHQLHHLAWIDENYSGNKNVRNAKRYARNLVEELAELVEATA